MLKRRYGNRPNWKRVIEKDYKQTYVDSNEFTGYIGLLKIDKVTEPLFVHYNEKSVCIADTGYSWLQQFPINKRHAVTTMFDSQGEIVQWYIDICKETGVENTIAWMDDLFLDIVILPSGEVIQIDADELEEALVEGVINQSLYDAAWVEAKHLHQLIENEDFDLIKLSKVHKRLLEYRD